MTIACIIPARLNSSRFPGKLLAKVGSKTVLQRTFEKALACKDIDALFVATDHDLIEKHVQSFGGQIIRTSPECQNGTERIVEALAKDPRLQKTSLIVNLQGDHPCTEPKTLTAIVRALLADPLAVMSSAVTPILSREDYLSPQVVKCVFDQDHNALYFSRSPIPYIKEGLPLTAFAHIGVYCYRTAFLKKIVNTTLTKWQKSEDLEQLQVLEKGHRIKIAVVDELPLGIDTPKDLEKLKEILCLLNTSL